MYIFGNLRLITHRTPPVCQLKKIPHTPVCFILNVIGTMVHGGRVLFTIILHSTRPEIYFTYL